jgi:hypothetical protein
VLPFDRFQSDFHLEFRSVSFSLPPLHYASMISSDFTPYLVV